MKKLTTSYPLVALAAAVMLFSSCQKDSAQITEDSGATSTATVASTSIMVAATTGSSTATGTTAVKDSLALMKACPPGGKKDTVAFSALPASISTYLTANYAGYTFQKAFKVLIKAGVLDGYVVAINFNAKPVGLRFNASGTFLQVLEQRERPDMNGPGWHKGGRFENRGGVRGDTIALSALPATIKTYLTTNYATDTLLHAIVTRHDTTYIVISANKGLFATAFSSKLVFVKRVQLNPRPAKHAPINPATLPAAVTTYLATTYPGYVLDKAFAQKQNNVVSKYVVLIDASGTRYAVEFDGSGAFVKTTAVR